MDQKKIHETIIIGAGISGLACARKLHENNKEFLVISENIGGKCGEYSKGGISYGALFINNKTHPHVWKYVKPVKKVSFYSYLFYNEQYKSYSIYRQFFSHPIQGLKILLYTKKFLRKYKKFHKRCETMSQAQAIKSDPFLLKVYNQTVKEFITELKLKNFELAITQGTTSFFLTPIEQQDMFNATFPFLFMIMFGHEFIFLIDEFIKDIRKKIYKDTIIQIKKGKNFYTLQSKKRTLYAKNVVVATPPSVSKKLLHLNKIKKAVKNHIFHIAGIRHEPNKHDAVFYPPKDQLVVNLVQCDGTYIVYATEEKPRFENYFSEYKIIRHKFWNPAYHIGTKVLWECEQDKNLYLIGDHNIVCMEDAYITGLYAANQIINSK